jgi:biotin operon repressor
LRSEAFKTLGGSAIKVYLVIGLYSDFGTDWAYPSIRTIARQAGLSRQTVLTAIEQLCAVGLLVTHKAKGRSTAYRIIRQAPQRSSKKSTQTPANQQNPLDPSLKSLEGTLKSGLISLEEHHPAGLDPGPGPIQKAKIVGPIGGPKGELTPRDEIASIPIPGTPFRITAEGRLQVAVDLQELLTNQGISTKLAQRLLDQTDPEAVAKVILNAFYLQSQGKLQNGPGYIRAGIEDGYELLPQVASRLELRRQELAEQLKALDVQQRHRAEGEAQLAEQAAINYVLRQLHPEELQRLLDQALQSLPEPIVLRNPTLSNPFVRGKVYELACGDPDPHTSR